MRRGSVVNITKELNSQDFQVSEHFLSTLWDASIIRIVSQKFVPSHWCNIMLSLFITTLLRHTLKLLFRDSYYQNIGSLHKRKLIFKKFVFPLPWKTSACLAARSFLIEFLVIITVRKMSKYGDFSGLYFPVFGLNKEICRVTS